MPAVLCCCTVHTTSEKSTSLHSIHPIELPALVINSEPCAVTAGLWTQQLAAGRQALFHRICPPISCTQLSSSSPAIQSTTAAAGEGGLFHCCHHRCCLESPSPYFLFDFFLPKFSTVQTHPPLSCAAGLICLSGLAFCLSFAFFFFLPKSKYPSVSAFPNFYSTISIFLSLFPIYTAVFHAGYLDELFSFSAVVGFLSFASSLA